MTTSARVTMARESLRIRERRRRYFPGDIFDEYAWVLLLHAYLRRAGAAVPDDGGQMPPIDGPVMRHWRRYLEQQALIAAADRETDPVELTPDAADRLDRYLDELARAADALP